ncbi:hypothetical protein CFC21_011578 [Triticum aestivum]|uniref:DUF4283 domain-containing protein n=2 Tax=Triticum aestivum TaxID=4565 RepID=A0A9R1IVY0_WHEAT|nr:hypothetical protein CFC21_011578 [Triticum aestivum]
MDDLERRLQLAVVMYVGGARPPVSCEDAAVAVAAQLGIPRFQFSVHKFHPEDFLVVFAAHQFRNLALAVPSIEHQGIKLFIKPWLRQVQATSRLMRVQVDVMIEGVPSHVWSQSTAAEILGSACLIESLAPETASREDLSLFKLRAWCVDPDEVPVFRRLWVPEPVGTTHDPAARAPAFRQLLEYPALVHIGRLRDFSPPELWRGRSDSDDGSGQSGFPDSSRGSQFGGDWVVQPWSRGVRDARGSGREQPGPANGGAGGRTGRSYRAVLEGRVGPSDWRLPHMGAGQRSGLVGQGDNFATTTEEIPRHSNLARTQLGSLATRRETAGELAASDPLAKGGEEIEAPDRSAFAANQVRAVVQQQGTLVLGSEVARQEKATNQKAPEREVQHVDTAAVEDDLVVPTRTEHEVGPGDVQPASLDPVLPDSPRDPPPLAVAQEMEPQIIPAHQIVVMGHDQSNGWAPAADLLHGSAGGQPMSEVEVAPTSIPGAMHPDVGRDGSVGDVTTYAACDDLALISSEPAARNNVLELNATEARLSYKEELAVNNIKNFCAGLLKKLAPPPLKEFEGLRGVKPGQDPFTPRRTTRSLGVGGPRKSKASAAETVLLKTLGFDCEDLAVSEDALGQLRQVFDSPLQEQQLRAIAAIFGKAIPFNMGGEVESDAMAIA